MESQIKNPAPKMYPIISIIKLKDAWH